VGSSFRTFAAPVSAAPLPILGLLLTGLLPSAAPAHNALTSHYGLAGYRQDIEMRVTHGCKGSPVNEVRISIPEGVLNVSVEDMPDWSIETRMRKLSKPVPGEGGNMISETVGEIIWKTTRAPIPPMGRWRGFRFRANLPNTPDEILYFRSVNICEKGDDKYIDLPTEPPKRAAAAASR
jgi:periplasmic copper chaperone A